jgi:hypothetical protein
MAAASLVKHSCFPLLCRHLLLCLLLLLLGCVLLLLLLLLS